MMKRPKAGWRGKNMLDSKGFDLWADGYDESVGITEDENKYPFAGYKEVLAEIYGIVAAVPGAAVLDLGFGTGVLTKKLYERGCEIYGQDFSERMIELARAGMPEARLCAGDLAQGLAEPLRAVRYDFIVATYSLHHLADERKRALAKELLGLLRESGKLLIGDVAFENRAALEACRAEAGEEWDDEEIYFVVDEWKETFPKTTFLPKSFCAGVLIADR